jgi:hypothetical protein
MSKFLGIANIVREQKSTRAGGDLNEAIDDPAWDFALIEPNPEDWSGWVIYFVDQLKEESKIWRKWFDFNTMLDTLVCGLENRMRKKNI